MSNISRRQFFGSTAAVAAVGLTGAAHAADLCSIPKKWDHTVDVIIVGAGGAGLAAAITALEKGAKVAILEKLGMPGGNTMVSGGGMNGAIVEEAKKAGIEDSPKLHTEQTLAAGDFRADPALVAQYAEKMPETVEWFRKLGVTFTPIYQIYGGLWPRCRNPQGQKGYAYIEAMLKRLKELKGEVLTNHKVTAFIRENPSEGRVLGVEVEVKGKKEYWRATKGVVATAGGYAYNAEMCAYFDPRLTKLSTTNQPGATGEVLVAMQDIGALAIGLDYIQCIPGTAPGYKSKGNLIQVIEYSIFVNKEGKRFVAEDSRRDVIRDATRRLPRPVRPSIRSPTRWASPRTTSSRAKRTRRPWPTARSLKRRRSTNSPRRSAFPRKSSRRRSRNTTSSSIRRRTRSAVRPACSRTRSRRPPSMRARSGWPATTRWAASRSTSRPECLTVTARSFRGSTPRAK